MITIEQFDSLGARQLPNQQIAFAQDYKHDDLYQGDEVYSDGNHKLLKEDLYDFCKKVKNKDLIELLFNEVDEEVIIEYLELNKEEI